MGRVAQLSEARALRRSADESPRRAKLTKRFVESIVADDAEVWVWDSELRSFGLRVKPSGVRTYVIQYRNQGGRTRRYAIGKHGVLTAEEARRLARLKLVEVQQGGDPSADRKAMRRARTVGELCDRYIEDYALVQKKESSVREDRRLIAKRVRPALGPINADAVVREDVIRVHNSLQKTPYEANRTLALLSKLFNLAEIWGIRSEGSNPCRLVRRFPEKERKSFLTEAELTKLGEVLIGEEDTGRTTPGVIIALRLLALTGCRMSELLDLRWKDVDLEASMLFLPDSKTGAKAVPLGAPAREYIRTLERRGDFVVPGTQSGSPLSKNTLECAWRRIRDKAGLKARIHDLRHTVGTFAGQSGLNSFLVRDILGHKTLAITGRYVSQDSVPLLRAADEVSRRIHAALGPESKDG